METSIDLKTAKKIFQDLYRRCFSPCEEGDNTWLVETYLGSGDIKEMAYEYGVEVEE